MDASNGLLSRDSNFRKSSGIAFAALLVFGAVAGVLAYSPGNALAQTVTIQTSADRFYGNSLLQVIVNDSAKNSASITQETTAVSVSVKSDTGATVAGPVTVNAREIGANSGQFEFFISTVNGQQPGTPRSETTPANTAIVRANASPASDGTNDVLLDTGTVNAGNNWRFVIEYVGSPVKEVLFATSSATFTLDRSTAGSSNNVIFIVNDRDANRDPTATDTITAVATTSLAYLDVDPRAGQQTGDPTIFTSQAGGFTAGAFTLTETGANTNIFEATVTQGAVTTDTTRTYEFTDFDVYSPLTGGTYAVAATSSKITQTLVLTNTDGVLTPITAITFGGEIPITVTDSDRNTSTRSEQTFTSTEAPAGTLTGGVMVTIDGTAATTERELLTMKETGDNTGIFRPNLNNGVLPVTFLSSTGTPTPNNGVLEVAIGDLQSNNDIIIQYFDNNKNAGATAGISSTVRLPITHTPGTLTFNAATAQANEKITVTLNDPDLNNSRDARDSFTVPITTTSNTIPLTINGVSHTNIADFELSIKGSTSTLSTTAQTITFIETNSTSGIFVGQLDVSKLQTSFNDGDKIELKYKDKMEGTTSVDSTASFTIGKPSTAITVDRTSAPLPLTAAESGTGADSVKVRVTITDPTRNTDSSVQETIASTAIDAGTTANDISATRSDGSTAVTIGTAGTELTYTAFSLTETGPNTGVFSGQVTIQRGTDTAANLDNARVKFTWDSNTATVTLRPSDLVISSSSSVVKNGDKITVTINDADRNRDPEQKETVSFTMTTQNDSISAANGGVLTTTATETGPNTGIFTKDVTIGTDIKTTLVGASSTTQAREIKIESVDRMASDRTQPTRELVLSVGAGTGSLVVTPEVVGPGTKLTVTVVDNDLNANPAGVDTVAGTTEYVTITTDRSGFPSTRLAGEETGANTGLFKSTIKLAPKLSAANVAPVTPTGAGTKDVSNVEVLPGDLISIKYVDAKNQSGQKVTISKVIQVISADPTMNATKTAYPVGETILVTVTDPDANRDGEVIDSVRVKVTSDQDAVGFDVTGLETGANTGVFTFSIPTTSGVSAGSITVSNGSMVKVKYNDAYPADYATRVKQVADASKDFFLTIPIGAPASSNSTTPSKPALADVTGASITEVTSGQQVVLTTNVKNNDGTSRPFVAIVEVRDSDGITVMVQWQTGTLAPNGDAGVGISWVPESAGEYEIRTFVVSNLSNPQVLSPVVTSNVTVS